MARRKLYEVEKDFAIGNKVRIDIVDKHTKPPKSESQHRNEQVINIAV